MFLFIKDLIDSKKNKNKNKNKNNYVSKKEEPLFDNFNEEFSENKKDEINIEEKENPKNKKSKKIVDFKANKKRKQKEKTKKEDLSENIDDIDIEEDLLTEEDIDKAIDETFEAIEKDLGSIFQEKEEETKAEKRRREKEEEKLKKEGLKGQSKVHKKHYKKRYSNISKNSYTLLYSLVLFLFLIYALIFIVTSTFSKTYPITGYFIEKDNNYIFINDYTVLNIYDNFGLSSKKVGDTVYLQFDKNTAKWNLNLKKNKSLKVTIKGKVIEKNNYNAVIEYDYKYNINKYFKSNIRLNTGVNVNVKKVMGKYQIIPRKS